MKWLFQPSQARFQLSQTSEPLDGPAPGLPTRWSLKSSSVRGERLGASGEGIGVAGMRSRLIAPEGEDLARTAGAVRNEVKSHVGEGVRGGGRRSANVDGRAVGREVVRSMSVDDGTSVGEDEGSKTLSDMMLSVS
jgi:hypothetical protein